MSRRVVIIVIVAVLALGIGAWVAVFTDIRSARTELDSNLIVLETLRDQLDTAVRENSADKIGALDGPISAMVDRIGRVSGKHRLAGMFINAEMFSAYKAALELRTRVSDAKPY